MKRRVRIDSTILALVIVSTAVFYLFPHLYAVDRFWDNSLDFWGVAFILCGIYLRMLARSYKKAHSRQSQELVTSGPYRLVRNPMYLGSFLIGAGFVFIVWPWWTLPFFTLVFYLRFNREMVIEEQKLTEIFGEVYKTYCREVPRVIPRLNSYDRMNLRADFDRNEIWRTKERRGLWAWPLLALVLESLQESLVFGYTDPLKTIAVFSSAAALCALLLWYKTHYG